MPEATMVSPSSDLDGAHLGNEVGRLHRHEIGGPLGLDRAVAGRLDVGRIEHHRARRIKFHDLERVAAGEAGVRVGDDLFGVGLADQRRTGRPAARPVLPPV